MFGTMLNFLQDLRKQRGPASSVAATDEKAISAPVPAAKTLAPIAGLDILLQPGPAVKRAQPVADAKIAPPPAVILPVPVAPHTPAASTLAQESNPDHAPIDWEQERREDLPVRTPGRIRFLLRSESEIQTILRIINDKIRFHRQNNLPIW
jgi:hypothetical protein